MMDLDALPRLSEPHHAPNRGVTMTAKPKMQPAISIEDLAPCADKLLALLVARADVLVGCPEGSPEDQELEAIIDALEAYEAVRWPEGRVEGGKG